MASQSPRLPDMPTEVHLQIASYLQFPDTFNIRNSCKTIQRKLPAPTVEELLAIEQLDILPNFYRNIFACVMCLRLRPREKFADNSRVRKKGKNGELRHRRYCVDCGRNPYECTTTDGKRVSVTIYSPGSLLFIMGEKFVVCIRCGRFGRGDKKCFKRDGFNLTTPAGRCNDCPEECHGERESLYCMNAADRSSAEVWWNAQTE